MVGALEVERSDELHFRIGSGLSDAERRKPPAIGTTITYLYNGLTTNDVPRFARFLRVRDDSSPPCRRPARSEEHTADLQYLMSISYAVFILTITNISNI